MWMPIVLLEQFRHLHLVKISSIRLQLNYNVLVSSEVKEVQDNIICYDAIPPNSSELIEDFMYNDAIPSNSSELIIDFMYNDAIPPNSSEQIEDFMYNNAIPPNSSELIEDFMNNDANPDPYISANPEPSIKYAAASSSSLQQNYPLKPDDNSTTNICSADKIVPIIPRYFSSPLTLFLFK